MPAAAALYHHLLSLVYHFRISSMSGPAACALLHADLFEVDAAAARVDHIACHGRVAKRLDMLRMLPMCQGSNVGGGFRSGGGGNEPPFFFIVNFQVKYTPCSVILLQVHYVTCVCVDTACHVWCAAAPMHRLKTLPMCHGNEGGKVGSCEEPSFFFIVNFQVQ